MHRILCVLFMLLPATVAGQDLRLSQIFSDHMVLQRDQAAPIWGWTKPGATVTVQFQGQTLKAIADQDGRWGTTFAPLKTSSEPNEMRVSSEGLTRIVRDILVGDVWLCSGQSNMEWRVEICANGKEEVANANYPLIRHIKPARNPQTRPQTEFSAAEWTVCSPKTAAGYTATGYYFGRHLHRELGIPIGLLNCSWGGTRIEPWTPQVGFELVKELKDIYQQVLLKDPSSSSYQKTVQNYLAAMQEWQSKASNQLAARELIAEPPPYPQAIKPYTSHQSPTVLYNGMIAPLVPFAIKGSIWYQGESNRHDGMDYVKKTQALVDGWRSVWGRQDLPYYYVQIAPYHYDDENPNVLAEFWLAQAEIEKQIPHSGMVVISDIGDLNDIHPTNKQDVGKRLANMALARTYGRAGIVDRGPVYRSHVATSNKLVLTFDHVGSGLASRDGKPLTTFEIGSVNRPWTAAEAKITSPNTIELSSDRISKPTVVRFAFHKLATPNLMNKDGLPAQTFVAGDVPEWDHLTANIPEAADYELVYDLDLNNLDRTFTYDVDHTAKIGDFDRVAYFLELGNNNGSAEWVFVSLDAFTDDVTKIGVPTFASGASFQQNVTNLNVYTSTRKIPWLTEQSGNIEFWPNNYATQFTDAVSSASRTKYDFGDRIARNKPEGYGSMQIHLTSRKQTIFAINNWKARQKADIGIGNGPGEHPDWTFTGSGQNYSQKRLRVLVRERN